MSSIRDMAGLFPRSIPRLNHDASAQGGETVALVGMPESWVAQKIGFSRGCHCSARHLSCCATQLTLRHTWQHQLRIGGGGVGIGVEWGGDGVSAADSSPS